jgi:DNA-binding XRE family transcriptional regulator
MARPLAALTEAAVGNRVREARERRLMTQADLAEKAQVALRTIHSVEKGMNCRADTKRKILGALELGLEDRDQVFPAGVRPIVRRRGRQHGST